MSRDAQPLSQALHSDRLIEVAKNFYHGILNDPETAIRERLAKNFVLENYLPSQIPFGGRYEGPQGLVKYLTEISEALEMGPLKFHEWVGAADSVVVRGSESSAVRATGKRYTMDFVHWLRFDENDRVVHMREFNDTDKMAVAFRKDPS